MLGVQAIHTSVMHTFKQQPENGRCSDKISEEGIGK